MTELNQVYKCLICGNMVEVIHTGRGKLVCCGQPMILEPLLSEDKGAEKHVPVIIEEAEGIIVKVGSAAHPMQEEHSIEWVEAVVDGKVYRQHLKPGEPPVAFFPMQAENVEVRAYCNLHGLWKA